MIKLIKKFKKENAVTETPDEFQQRVYEEDYRHTPDEIIFYKEQEMFFNEIKLNQTPINDFSKGENL